MRLVYYSYIFFGLFLFNLFREIQVEEISSLGGLGSTCFGSGVHTDHDCHKAANQKNDRPYYIAEGEAFLCDHKKFLRCSNGTCICFRGYSYNSLREICEPDRLENLVRRRREAGKALPDEKCYFSGDCVEGLYCIKDLCKCPTPCKYEKDEGVCDCGEVNYEFPVKVRVITALLCLMSAGIWGFIIIRTYRNGKDKSLQNNNNEDVDEDVPLEMNYLHQPSKPDMVGQENYQVPFDPPPAYQRMDYAPFNPPGGATAVNTSAWTVTPAPGTQNTNSNLTSESKVETSMPFGTISGGNQSNYGVPSTSVISSENVPLVDTPKSQDTSLPYSPFSRNVSSPLTVPSTDFPSTLNSYATQQNTSEGASLPHPILPQNVSSPLPDPSTEVTTLPPYTTQPNTSEGPSLPYPLVSQNVSSPIPAPSTGSPYPPPPSSGAPSPPPPSSGAPSPPPPYTTEPNSSKGPSLPYSINPLNVPSTSPPTSPRAPPSAPPYTSEI